MNCDLTGRKFGRLTALRDIGNQTWKCYCSCYNAPFVNVSKAQLLDGSTQSCGCLRKETARETGKRCGRRNIIEYNEKKTQDTWVQKVTKQKATLSGFHDFYKFEE